MHSTFITSRLFSCVRPSIGIRLVPSGSNASRLGPADHSYVCIGDHEEFKELTINQIATTIFGIDVPPNDGNGLLRKYAFPAVTDHWPEAWHVLLIRLGDDAVVDLFPGTWKSVAFILQDENRMKRNPELHKHFLKVRGGFKHDFISKEGTDFLELDGAFRWEPDGSPQAAWYNYLSADSAFTEDIVREFGIANRCWHGRGYIGTAPVVLARVFLIKNLKVVAPAVIDLGILAGERTLPDTSRL